MRFKTSMLTVDLCDYNDAHIIVKKPTTVTTTNNDSIINKN